METLKHLSRRSFVMIMLFMSILLLLCDVSYNIGFDFFSEKAAVLAGSDASQIVRAGIISAQRELKIPFTLAAAGVFFITGCLIWLVLRISMGQIIAKKGEKEPVKKDVKKDALPAVNKLEKIENDRRMYLHLFSVLQREGRLMDFFSEDLAPYEDAQIGAAVRNIQENCKKTIEKYLKPVSVLDQNEGDEVTVESNFDPDAIKLIGNVSGEPPFKGIIRHKGWKASKSELPKLSSSRDSKLIAPAEVEIS